MEWRVRLSRNSRRRFGRSRAMHERACAVLPGGMSHDVRRMRPFPLFADRALGSRKWDVDGHELIDYQMGHGALLLGHSHPGHRGGRGRHRPARGMHFGAEHPLEIDWAAQIVAMVPSAERVRFTSSGTEASLLAMQLARASTEREKILKFDYHFHGWHDDAKAGQDAGRPAVAWRARARRRAGAGQRCRASPNARWPRTPTSPP